MISISASKLYGGLRNWWLGDVCFKIELIEEDKGDLNI